MSVVKMKIESGLVDKFKREGESSEQLLRKEILAQCLTVEGCPLLLKEDPYNDPDFYGLTSYDKDTIYVFTAFPNREEASIEYDNITGDTEIDIWKP